MNLLRLLNPKKGATKPPLSVLDNAALLEALRLCREALRGRVELSPEALDALDSLLALEHPGYSVLEAHEARERELLAQLPRPVIAGKEMTP